MSGIRELSSPTWQPIETAPKDWSDVLLYDPERERPIFEGFYSCADGGWGRWMAANDGPWDPTHWMPLPPPPVGSGRNLADANSKSPIQAREE